MDKSLLVDAKMLAAFANLEPADADTFRHAVAPNFVPNSWWGGQALEAKPGAKSEPIWQSAQRRLRDVWRLQFPWELCLELIIFAAKSSALDQLLEKVDLSNMSNKEIFDFAKQDLPKPESWPYQRVLMRLAMEPWRGRICAICGKYFVKDKPRERYCSKACSKQAVLTSKSRSWALHAKDWRPKPSKKPLKMKGR